MCGLALHCVTGSLTSKRCVLVVISQQAQWDSPPYSAEWGVEGAHRLRGMFTVLAVPPRLPA